MVGKSLSVSPSSMPGPSLADDSDRGVRCDIPSVVYQYTWNPKVWNEYYSGGAEILQYLKDTVEDFQLASMLHLRHIVTEARWYDNVGKWKLNVTSLEDGRQFEDECDVFVNAMGFLKSVLFITEQHTHADLKQT